MEKTNRKHSIPNRNSIRKGQTIQVYFRKNAEEQAMYNWITSFAKQRRTSEGRVVIEALKTVGDLAQLVQHWFELKGKKEGI